MKSFFAIISFIVVLAVLAAPAQSSPTPLTPRKRDWSKFSKASFPPNNLDHTVDHALNAYNIYGNQSWALTQRPWLSEVVWVHESRWYTTKSNRTTILECDEGASLEARGTTDGITWDANANSNDGCPTPTHFQRGFTCTPTWTWNNHAGGFIYFAAVPRITAPSTKYVAKVNAYGDDWCDEYLYSVVGDYGFCLSSWDFLSFLSFSHSV